MSEIGEGFKAFNWITKQIDTAANFFKRKGRENEVNKINNAVNTGVGLGGIVQSIKKDRDKRADA